MRYIFIVLVVFIFTFSNIISAAMAENSQVNKNSSELIAVNKDGAVDAKGMNKRQKDKSEELKSRNIDTRKEKMADRIQERKDVSRGRGDR